MSRKTKMVASQTAMAALIAREFDIPCSKQSLQNWQRKWEPPFPSPKANGKYERAECLAWVRKHYLPKFRAEGAQIDLLAEASKADSEVKILKREEKQFELALKRGEYVERDAARGVIIAALKKYHLLVKTEIEQDATADRMAKLVELGIAQETISIFREWDARRSQVQVDRIEAACRLETESATAVEL